MKKTAILLLATLVLVTACASETTPSEPGESVAEDSKKKESENRRDQKKPGVKSRTPGDEHEKGKERTQGDRSPKRASAGGGGTESGSDAGDRNEGDRGPRRSGSESGPGRRAPYPRAGKYTFAQSGYEEFCDTAGSCDKERLPKRQPAKVTYESRSASSAVVVTKQKTGSRAARTWTRFTPSGAHITKMHVSFEYSGYGFERTYVPDPPVEALRFPFTTGERWSGRWKASTSGSYSVRVRDRSQLRVGGRTITVYRVETSTEFRGDFEGKSRITAYFDVDTKALVATDGVLNVTSQFGRYTTVFETKLVAGPGY